MEYYSPQIGGLTEPNRLNSIAELIIRNATYVLTTCILAYASGTDVPAAKNVIPIILSEFSSLLGSGIFRQKSSSSGPIRDIRRDFFDRIIIRCAAERNRVFGRNKRLYLIII
ncbi:hypothetical protein DERF_010816 [Dermatophagoides farinae]|uniref:Uncharacterized protein n=1 Tax=Dermatophagoides farinae TaxID=6954 RepID=A0A922HTP5_DERFA|nr:hypothetical protein DERF_010816 [Dermatophagoides farinae]